MQHRAIRLGSTALFIFGLCLGSAALATDQYSSTADAFSPLLTDCPTTDYIEVRIEEGLVLTTGFAYTLGPASTPTYGAHLAAVMLDLQMTHAAVGELVAQISLDTDCDGNPEVGPLPVLCRPGLPPPASCDPLTPGGCSGAVDGTYRFSDLGDASLGEPDCPAIIDPDCFLPAPESVYEFADFFGAAGDCCFWLEISDSIAGNLAYLHSWTIWYQHTITPVEPSTWGAIKCIYED